MEPIVTTEWLAKHLSDPDLRVVDGTWHMPHLKRDPRAEFEAAHVPGAVFFDIDAIADRTTTLPHMLPTAEQFGAAVGALGIGNGDRVVVYDVRGVVSAARVWWTFRAFGHDAVAVLDGGLREVARGGAAGRERAGRPDAARVHRAPRGPSWSATWKRCAPTSEPAPPRCSTRAAPAASPAPSRSRGRGCGAVTSPAA